MDHAVALPFTGRSRVAVPLGVAQAAIAAQVLIKELRVIAAARGYLLHLAHHNVAHLFIGGAHIVSVTDGVADDVRLHDISRGRLAHHFVHVLLLIKLFGLIRGHQYALGSPADTAAIYPRQIAFFMQLVNKALKRLFSAEGRPHIRRRPGGRALPVHGQGHNSALQLLLQLIDIRQAVFQREILVRRHIARIFCAAHRVKRHHGGALHPFGQLIVFADFRRQMRAGGFQPAPIPFGSGIPIAVEYAQHHFIGQGVSALHGAGE